MYESPINVFERNICNELTEEKEKLVIAAVHEVCVTVDKEELEKALRYDRQQYEKGYADAKMSGRKVNGYCTENTSEEFTTYRRKGRSRRITEKSRQLINAPSAERSSCCLIERRKKMIIVSALIAARR